MVGGVDENSKIRGHVLVEIRACGDSGRVVRPAHTKCGQAHGGDYYVLRTVMSIAKCLFSGSHRSQLGKNDIIGIINPPQVDGAERIAPPWSSIYENCPSVTIMNPLS